MAEERKPEVEDDDLSALLDSALADFGKTSNTDDEVDSLMVKMDSEAVEKAAKNFDQLMQKASQRFGASTSGDNSSQNVDVNTIGNHGNGYPLTSEDLQAAENFQNMMKALIQAEEKSRLGERMETDASDFDKAATEDLFSRLKALTERDPVAFLDDSSWLPVLEFAKTIFAKDFMYPTVKQIHANFLEYMAKTPELSAEMKQNYEKQINVLSRICNTYEREQSDSSDLSGVRAEEICNLVMELQTYGYPPEQVVGSMPPGWSIDQSTGLPCVDDVSKAADACALM